MDIASRDRPPKPMNKIRIATGWTVSRSRLYRRASQRFRAQVAQLVEHVTENHGVGGSIPSLGTIFLLPSPALKELSEALGA